MTAELELKKIVGSDNVSLEPIKLKEYSRDMSFVDPMKPDYIVKPGNISEIESLVKFANSTLMPLVPVSSGSPHSRGDTVPCIGGSTIVDLSRMKKIIRVDRVNRVAMVEPGVTFEELIPAVKKEGIRMNIPLLPRKTKSVLGSLLEREPVTMPVYHWDMADPLNCIEIVFGNGEVYRTGGAAGPGTIEQQWAAKQAQTDAAGPSQGSFHTLIQGSQGTLGIATWTSLRCEIMPKIESPFLAGSLHLDKILELAHWLVRLRLVNECFILNNSNLAAIMAQKDSTRYQEIKSSLPDWILFFNIVGYDYFPEKRVDYQTKDMQDQAGRIGLDPVNALGKVSASSLLELAQNVSPEPYWKLRANGAYQDIFFLAMMEKLPDLIKSMNMMANEAGYPTSNMGVYIQPVAQGTSYHCEFNLFYNPNDLNEVNRIKQLSSSATRRLLDEGAFFSRPYGENAGMVFSREGTTIEALRKVKKVFDPNNIMNPGKLCF
jgi:hypothetical protein